MLSTAIFSARSAHARMQQRPGWPGRLTDRSDVQIVLFRKWAAQLRNGNSTSR